MEKIFIESHILATIIGPEIETEITTEYIEKNKYELIPDIYIIEQNLNDYICLYQHNYCNIKNIELLLSMLHKYKIQKYYIDLMNYVIWQILELKFIPTNLCPDIKQDFIEYNHDFSKILNFLFFGETKYLDVNDFTFSIALYDFTPSDYKRKWVCLRYPIKYGLLDVVKYITSQNDCNTDYICRISAEFGQLEILQWARENDYYWDELVCRCAAKYGHLNVLEWARINGCSWNTLTCADAVICNNFDILKWARINGCPWDYWTTINAARYGRFDILKWAYENDCPIDKDLCIQYAEYYPEMKIWLQNLRTPF